MSADLVAVSVLTTRCLDDSTKGTAQAPGPFVFAESANHVPGHSVSYVPVDTPGPAPTL